MLLPLLMILVLHTSVATTNGPFNIVLVSSSRCNTSVTASISSALQNVYFKFIHIVLIRWIMIQFRIRRCRLRTGITLLFCTLLLLIRLRFIPCNDYTFNWWSSMLRLIIIGIHVVLEFNDTSPIQFHPTIPSISSSRIIQFRYRTGRTLLLLLLLSDPETIKSSDHTTSAFVSSVVDCFCLWFKCWWY